MRSILLFGAGKSATVLIHYLLQNAAKENWHLTVVDVNIDLVKSKIEGHNMATALSFNIEVDDDRIKAISAADLVISLLPPALHLLVAKDCIAFKKNLLTASYIDADLKKYEQQIKEAGLLFLCETGLDPGIDHMSAKKILDDIKENGGKVTSFISHCGGLVADESDDSPWHYKISWNPKNIVMAGKSGAVYLREKELTRLSYEQLFAIDRKVIIPQYKELSWYPNRDSLLYASLYGLEDCHTFIRTTLRHPHFMTGWKNIVHLKLTDEEKVYETDGKSISNFFKEHLEKHGLENEYQQQLFENHSQIKNLWEESTQSTSISKGEDEKESDMAELIIIDKTSDYKSKNKPEIKKEPNAPNSFNEEHILFKQLLFLGFINDETTINKGLCSAADVLQYALEKKLSLATNDKDLVVMLHEIEYEKKDKKYKTVSTLLVKGEDNQHTAMAKTVGLPLGIAAKLILNEVIKTKGLQIPIHKEIYDPILDELTNHQINFNEEQTLIV